MRCALIVAMVVAWIGPAAAQTRDDPEPAARPQRQRIIVTPLRRYLSPNARRECEARLVQQERPDGTVIVPVMNCVWR